MRHVFHSFKNLLALLTILSDEAIDDFGTKDSIDNLMEIKENLAQFTDRMNRVLDVSYYSKMEYDLVNIIDCINSAISKFLLVYDRKINANIECHDVIIYGERYSFIEVFYNLLCNAGASTPEDGEILVKVWTENRWICVSFKDNGCGIPKKMQKKIFKPFVSSKRSFTNWGLGLAYVDEVVTANGGFVNVRSKLGEFTEFQIIFPKFNNDGETL